MIWTVVSWLTGTGLGRKVLSGGIIALVVLIVVWRIFAAGKAAERAKQVTRSLDLLRKRVKTNEKVRKMSPSERRDYLKRQWMRP